MQLLIIGGDSRNRHLAALAMARGMDAQLIGHDETPLGMAKPSKLVVMPFPKAEAEGKAPAPFFSDKEIDLRDVCPLILPGATVFATSPGPVLSKYIQETGCTRIDFTENEAFTLRNAVPSAEGAIFAAMQKSGSVITGQRCLIIGYGRIGRALALRLRGLMAHVTIAARSFEQRAMAEGDGCEAVSIDQACSAPENSYQILFNTVPAKVVGEKLLLTLSPDGLAIDLASPPYGIDLELAKTLGITAWREPGLPGRYAPRTAAEAMLEAILEKDGA